MSDLPILVCGFLGTGKSALMAHLQGLGHAAEEVDGLFAPSAVAAGETRRVITVVDCANAARQLEDPLIRPLLRRQIGAAGLVAVSRGDLSDPAPVQAMVKELADCPVVDALNGTISVEHLSALSPMIMPSLDASDDLTTAFGTWTYGGAALFRGDQAERLIANRPDGIERMAGVLRTDDGGLEVQLAGRVRQTQAVALPDQTELAVRWRLSETPQSQIDLWFAEAVADSGHKRGLFGYR